MTELSVTATTGRPGFLRAVGNAIAAVFVRYRKKQAHHELAALDDHLLEDMGIDRAALSTERSAGGRAMHDELHVLRHRLG